MNLKKIAVSLVIGLSSALSTLPSEAEPINLSPFCHNCACTSQANSVYDTEQKVKKAADFLRKKINFKPEILIILGSGLGPLADIAENKIEISYNDIPGFAVSTVEGHVGSLVFGQIEGKNVVIMRGRVHCYEGYKANQVVLPVLTAKALGVKTLIVSNSSGAISQGHYLGELILIKDHINFLGSNPMVGPNSEKLGPRFFDMNSAYTEKLRRLAFQEAEKMGIKLKEGVYAAMLGPSYETPAERKMLRIMGADVVGMSTVPEVIAAVYSGMQVLGFSCVTDVPADIPKLVNKDESDSTFTNHEDVLKTAEKAQSDLGKLIKAILKNID
ncbi:MAG: purine-nucleoside phosphorylase [Candidatus Bruticola sp.]